MLGAVVSGLGLASRTLPPQHAGNCSRQLVMHRKEGPQLGLRLCASSLHAVNCSLSRNALPQGGKAPRLRHLRCECGSGGQSAGGPSPCRPRPREPGARPLFGPRLPPRVCRGGRCLSQSGRLRSDPVGAEGPVGGARERLASRCFRPGSRRPGCAVRARLRPPEVSAWVRTVSAPRNGAAGARGGGRREEDGG